MDYTDCTDYEDCKRIAAPRRAPGGREAAVVGTREPVDT
jgi:hypothetical protein